MVWKPGESGNPKGKKPGTLKERPYRDALRMEIAAAEDFKDLRSSANCPSGGGGEFAAASDSMEQ